VLADQGHKGQAASNKRERRAAWKQNAPFRKASSVAQYSPEVVLAQAVKGPYSDAEGSILYFCEHCRRAKPVSAFGAGVATACSDCLQDDRLGSRSDVVAYLFTKLDRGPGCHVCGGKRDLLYLDREGHKAHVMRVQRRSRSALDAFLAQHRYCCPQHAPFTIKQEEASAPVKENNKKAKAAYIEELKQKRGCLVCGGLDDLNFVHKVKSSTNKLIANMKSYSKLTIFKEAAKCHVLCRFHIHHFKTTTSTKTG
jgi:hypothetical protein